MIAGTVGAAAGSGGFASSASDAAVLNTPTDGAGAVGDAKAMLDALERLKPGTKLAKGAFEVTSSVRGMA